MSAVERIVSRILWWGGVVSIALMLVGLVSYAAREGIRSDSFAMPRAAARGSAGTPPNVFTSVPQVLQGLRRGPIDSLAVATVGVLALLATPVIAVVAAIPAFVTEGDRRYALIATMLPIALIGSLLFGGAG